MHNKISSIYFVIVCWLHALLFTYAAVSKLLDYENFRIQLSQSPLLSIIAVPVSIGIPVLELILAFFLLFGRWQMAALFASYLLMVMFTAYIFIILEFSSYIPCSCGGILEKLGWTEHLWFNAGFVVLAASAILVHSPKNHQYVLA